MYDKVTEYTYQDDKPMYKTVYRYTLPDLGGYDMLTCEDLWNFHVHNYANWFSDHLVSKEVYENTVNGYKIVSSDNYVYGARVCPKRNIQFKDVSIELVSMRIFQNQIITLSMVSSIVTIRIIA